MGNKGGVNVGNIKCFGLKGLKKCRGIRRLLGKNWLWRRKRAKIKLEYDLDFDFFTKVLFSY